MEKSQRQSLDVNETFFDLQSDSDSDESGPDLDTSVNESVPMKQISANTVFDFEHDSENHSESTEETEDSQRGSLDPSRTRENSVKSRSLSTIPSNRQSIASIGPLSEIEQLEYDFASALSELRQIAKSKRILVKKLDHLMEDALINSDSELWTEKYRNEANTTLQSLKDKKNEMEQVHQELLSKNRAAQLIDDEISEVESNIDSTHFELSVLQFQLHSRRIAERELKEKQKMLILQQRMTQKIAEEDADTKRLKRECVHLVRENDSLRLNLTELEKKMVLLDAALDSPRR
ncbi:hypothetical protein BLNAU_19305 [Blattamonas nauphoetae]|uniref:Uncharacterized protein n=1 Tax=Blattamonas nauphoetae TaxID=2049346 RepID=A0ABQ9X1V4_9EUKA|nr:hypothetical protein BLNAU_19305 [Blattamonas nauphoetae]